MTEIRSQFGTAGANASGYIAASLNFMTADTRQGLTDSAEADFAVIRKYAAGHPDRPGVVNYVAKIEASVKKLTAAGIALKPSPKM
jgi:hypothetical protein